MTRHKRFNLEYDIQGVGPSGVARVELWATRDGGRLWERWGTDDDKQSPYSVEVDREGMFGFRIVVVGGNGLGGQLPQSGDEAECWIGVDQTPPQASITSAQYGRAENVGMLSIGWQAAGRRRPAPTPDHAAVLRPSRRPVDHDRRRAAERRPVSMASRPARAGEHLSAAGSARRSGQPVRSPARTPDRQRRPDSARANPQHPAGGRRSRRRLSPLATVVGNACKCSGHFAAIAACHASLAGDRRVAAIRDSMATWQSAGSKSRNFCRAKRPAGPCQSDVDERFRSIRWPAAEDERTHPLGAEASFTARTPNRLPRFPAGSAQDDVCVWVPARNSASRRCRLLLLIASPQSSSTVVRRSGPLVSSTCFRFTCDEAMRICP